MFSKVFKKLDFLKDNRGIAPLFILVLVAAAALAIPLTTKLVQQPQDLRQRAAGPGEVVAQSGLYNTDFCNWHRYADNSYAEYSCTTNNYAPTKYYRKNYSKNPFGFGGEIDVSNDILDCPKFNGQETHCVEVNDCQGDKSPLGFDQKSKGIRCVPDYKSDCEKQGGTCTLKTTGCGTSEQLSASCGDSFLACCSSTPASPTPTPYSCATHLGLEYKCDTSCTDGWADSTYNPNTTCTGTSSPVCCWNTKLSATEPTAIPTATPAPTTGPGTPTPKAPPYSGGTPQPPQPPGPKATPTPAGQPCKGSDICGNAYGTNVPNYCTYKNNAENDTWCRNATNVAGVWCYSCISGNPTIIPTPSVTLECPGSSASNNWATCGNAQFGGLGDCYNGNGSWSYKNDYSRDVWCKANAGSVKTYCYECHPNVNPIPSPNAPTPITPVPTFAACPDVNSDGSHNQCTTNSCTKAKPDGDSACQALYGNPNLKCCTVPNNLSPTCSTSNKQCLLSNSNPSNHASADCTGCGGYCLNTGAPGLPSGYGQCMSLY